MKDYNISDKELKKLKKKYNLGKILDFYFECREQTIKTIDRNNVPDLKVLDLGSTKTPLERLNSYLNQGYNPYFVKVNGHIVQINFVEDGHSIEECIINLVDREIESRDYLPPGKFIINPKDNN